jgi:serine/threonine protein kinase/tetratricopeptide (TPR) repeat protein
MPDRRDSDVTPTPPGAIIGHYEILAELGRGGMGVLYRARDQKLGRVVALKRPYAPGVVQRQRFEREARAAAQLAHPHIVPIFEVLEEDGVPWIAMELVEGRSLRSLLDLGEPLPLAEILRHAEGLAGALQAAHARGILHRDVNPKNIMITPEGRALLTDFGLARVNRDSSADTDTTDTQENDVTRAGSVLGTPGYMSPEQALGRPADPRSDLFCLGAVLYEMCTRTRAFSASDTGSVLDAVLHHDPPAVALCRKDCPPELERIVRKLLSKDAADRYQIAADVGADLRALRRQIEWERYGSGGYSAGRSLERARPMPRPQRRLVATGVALIAILGATAMFWPRTAEPGGSIDSVLIANIQNDSGNVDFNDTLREGLVATLGQSPSIRIVRDDLVDRALERMKIAKGSPLTIPVARELCQREGIRGLLAGRVRRSGDVYSLAVQLLDPVTGSVKLVETEQFKDPGDVFSRVDALADRVRARLGESMQSIEASSVPLEQATTPSFVALQLYSEGRRSARRGDFASAIGLFQRATTEDAEFGLSFAALGDAYSTIGKRRDAIEAYDRALRTARSTSARDRGLITANYYLAREEYNRAADELQALVALIGDDLRLRQELAQAYEAIGDRPSGIRELRECLRLSPTDERAYGNLMLRLVINQQPEESLAVYKEAEARGVTSPYLFWGLGVAQQVLGREADARATFANLRAAGGPYASYGRLYEARTDILYGQWQLASHKLGADVAILRDQRNRSLEITSRLLLARLRILSGESREAIADLKRLLREDDGAIRSNELRQIGTMLARANELAEAKTVLGRLQASVQSETESSAFVRSCVSNLQGEIALAEGRDGAAATMFAVARAAYPQHASAVGLARVHERRRQWSAAASAWKDVMAASGDILRYGFPADVPLARLQRARALTRAGLKEEAKVELEALRDFWGKADQDVVGSLVSRDGESQASPLRNQGRSQGET